MAALKGTRTLTAMLMVSGLLTLLPSVLALGTLGYTAWSEGVESLRSRRGDFNLVWFTVGLCVLGLGKALLELSAVPEASRSPGVSGVDPAAPSVPAPLRWLQRAWLAATAAVWALGVANVVYAVVWFLAFFVLCLRFLVITLFTFGLGAGAAWRSSGEYLRLLSRPFQVQSEALQALAHTPAAVQVVWVLVVVGLVLPTVAALYLHARRWTARGGR